jgi:hypothetical protein
MKDSFNKAAGKLWSNWLWRRALFLPSDRKITMYYVPNTIYLLSVINLGLFKLIFIHIITYTYSDIFVIFSYNYLFNLMPFFITITCVFSSNVFTYLSNFTQFLTLIFPQILLCIYISFHKFTHILFRVLVF